MNQTVQFSIVVPVYRVEAFLPQAIESVQAQSFSDWELILVDDGSPDRSGEICDRYAAMDKRIKVIHKPNGGAVSARQAGMEQCSGAYVAYLDGDDYWDSELLSQLQHVIQQYHPDGIAFGYRTVTEDGTPISNIHIHTPEGFYCGEALKAIWNKILYDPMRRELNTGSMFYSQWSSVFRREMVAPFQQKAPKHIKLGEDAAVTIPTACHCDNLYFLNITGYYYRIRENSAVRTLYPSEMQENIDLINHFRVNAKQIPVENLNGYLYYKTENYWVKVAKKYPDYRSFHNCVKTSFQIMPKDVMQSVSEFPLKFKYKVRILTMKYHLWFLFWLMYHRP